MKIFFNTIKPIQLSRKKFLSKSFENKVKNISLPIISTPILSYNLLATRNANNSINCRKAIAKQKERLDKGEITQKEYQNNVTEIELYYKKADKLPEKVNSQSIKQNEPSFKGTEEEILSNSALESSQMTDRELELAEIDNIDVSMCNELQEYLEKPLKSAGDGLLDNIVDLSDALIDVGDKTLSSIKNFVLNALDSF